MRIAFWTVAGLWFAAGIGCDSGGPRLYPVRGIVTVDDVPIAEGDILFVPEDRKQGPDHGRIKDGVFSFRAKEGKHRIEIRAYKSTPVPKSPPNDLYPYVGEVHVIQFLPARFNDSSTLGAAVEPISGNEYAFHLANK